MSGPRPRTYFHQTHPEVFGEAIAAVNRPEVNLLELGTHSNRSVLWLCTHCAHRWSTSMANRAAGRGCPECARVNRAASLARAPQGKSISDLHPLLAAEFRENLTRPDLGTTHLRGNSQQTCLWRCRSCHHEWSATVTNRVNGRGCPLCANKSRARHRRTPTAASGTAAQHADFPVAELLTNLTNSGLGLDSLRPNSSDRCRWRCSDCQYEWEATIVSRLSKKSGCPRCAARHISTVRSTAPNEVSLAALYPQIAAEFVSCLDYARSADTIYPGSNAVCTWRCGRGHEWLTTVASRVAGSGCARCGARGQSLLEFEVASILQVSTGRPVDLDVTVQAAGRAWRVDIAIPAIGILIDLDPARWHSDAERDQRKSDAMAAQFYVRLRPRKLPLLSGVRIVQVPDQCLDAFIWAEALGPLLVEYGLTWSTISHAQVGAALSQAAARWHLTLRGRPDRSAIDAAPQIAEELIENLTRPGIGLEWLSPSSKDRCLWRCSSCNHEWNTSIYSRAGLRTGCPRCSLNRAALARSTAAPGQSLSDLYPSIAEQFVRCLDQKDRIPSSLRSFSNLLCEWKCHSCGGVYAASPASRLRGRGCPECSRTRSGDARSRVPLEDSLATKNAGLAAELIDIEGRPGRGPSNVSPGCNFPALWECVKCSHRWIGVISSRALSGHGCPRCGRQATGKARSTPKLGQSLRDLHPELCSEFVSNLTHTDRDPDQLRKSSHDRCLWHCRICDYEWATSVKNRTRNNTGCPQCQKK